MAKQDKTNKSKYISYVLRHGLQELNLIPDPEGYIKLKDLIDKSNNQLDEENIIDIVNTCTKSRFSIKIKEGQKYIRANQGHSKSVGEMIDPTQLLKKIKEPINGVFHGSYQKNLESIQLNGLNRMSRQHIHLAKSLEAKSGKRNDCNLLIYIDMKQAIEDGMQFFESENGVILTEGINGILPTKYLTFQKI